MTRALLLRHGQSEWNARGRWQGQSDPPLTDLGRAQARHAARAMVAWDVLVSSDLARATETAAIISAELGAGPVLTDPGLRERDAGEWSGLTRDEIDERWPGYLQPRPDDGDPAAWRPKRPRGWEHDDALRARAIRALARINALAPGGEVLVVTHGGVVHAIEALLGASFDRLPNLAGRWVELGAAGPLALGERVVLVGPDEPAVPAHT